MLPHEFTSLSLAPELLAVIVQLGFEKMTPIQAKTLPLLLAGKDLIGQSKTGSGKTLAFTLPILHNLVIPAPQLQALVLCPTRELAAQVVSEMRKLGRQQEGLQILALTGGQPTREQAQTLEKGVHIAVGTPGRVLDLIRRDRLDFKHLKTLVLDEADKMFDMGFEEEIKTILRQIPTARQTVMFSATYPESILGLSRKYQKNPHHITVEDASESKIDIDQVVYDTEEADKPLMLMRVLQQHPSNSTIVFCNTKAAVNELVDLIAEQNVPVAALHGDIEQRERDRVMAMFRNGSHRILVATDVAARGLDIDNLELVINYDLPLQSEVYVHRIGRTGRAGRSGTAVSLAHPRDTLRLHELEQLTAGKFLRPQLGFKNQFGLAKDFKGSAMQTISISGGRKDKLRPGDILGALTGAGGLKGTDIGKIEIHDRSSYVAVASSQADSALEFLRTSKIKGHKFQVKFLK